MTTATTQSKRAYTVKRTYDTTAETVLFTAYDRNGQLIPGVSVRFEAKKASKSNRHFAMLFGFNQSIGDEMAQSAGSTLKEKFAAAQERAAFLMSGAESWTTGRGPSESSLLFRAMSEAYPKMTPEDVQKWIAERKAEAKKAEVTWATFQAKLLLSKKLGPIVEKLRAEEAKGLEIDTDSLFEELDAE